MQCADLCPPLEPMQKSRQAYKQLCTFFALGNLYESKCDMRLLLLMTIGTVFDRSAWEVVAGDTTRHFCYPPVTLGSQRHWPLSCWLQEHS